MNTKLVFSKKEINLSFSNSFINLEKDQLDYFMIKLYEKIDNYFEITDATIFETIDQFKNYEELIEDPFLSPIINKNKTNPDQLIEDVTNINKKLRNSGVFEKPIGEEANLSKKGSKKEMDNFLEEAFGSEGKGESKKKKGKIFCVLTPSTLALFHFLCFWLYIN